MKIGFDISLIHHQKAGCAWVAEMLSKELIYSQSKHKIVLFDHFIDWINYNLIYTNVNFPPHATAPLRNVSPKLAAKYWQKVKSLHKIDCDIVHSTNFQACKFSRSKLVYTLHDVTFWTNPDFAIEANRLACQKGVLNALKYAHGIVFVSEYSRNELHRILPGWNKRRGIKECVIPNGPSYTTEYPAVESSARKYWLMVGTVEPRKNHTAALDALEIYWEKSSRPLPLKIVGGRGWKSDDLHQRIVAMQKQGKVEFLGYQPDEKVIEFYRNATALLFPSWDEGFGLPVLEAMGLGCPVIAANRGSIPEVGADAVAYIDPSKPTEIATRMLHIENDLFEHRRMVINGRTRALEFSWKKSADRLLDFYNEVLT